jgi:hypothetical protein
MMPECQPDDCTSDISLGSDDMPGLTERLTTQSSSEDSSEGSAFSDLPDLACDEESSKDCTPPVGRVSGESELERAHSCIAMIIRASMLTDRGANASISAARGFIHHVDNLVWSHGEHLINADTGMCVYPSDEETAAATEDESTTPTEPGEIQATPLSVCVITATDPDDFCEEHWGSLECVGEHPFEDYNKWFNEDDDKYNANVEHDESDFCQGHRFMSKNNRANEKMWVGNHSMGQTNNLRRRFCLHLKITHHIVSTSMLTQENNCGRP